ncbi:hypothetical protein G7Y89_g9094 [Cudoniella acicularis]|uniref:Uncharacterized protein n=1 Tax=Cudoniella acicularis TaxID=354080 RepID=A0A8H4RFB5_9HELO|nr:hypothetical protein G7Y89_g9094 [Cudoniella acicularis]
MTSGHNPRDFPGAATLDTSHSNTLEEREALFRLAHSCIARINAGLSGSGSSGNMVRNLRPRQRVNPPSPILGSGISVRDLLRGNAPGPILVSSKRQRQGSSPSPVLAATDPQQGRQTRSGGSAAQPIKPDKPRFS